MPAGESERRSIWTATPIVIVYWVSGISLNYSNQSILHAVPAPALLTSFQMALTAILVQPAKCLAPQVDEPRPEALSTLLRVSPASICLAVTYVFGNIAHDLLSPGVVHLFAATHPILVYAAGCFAGIDDFSGVKVKALLLVSLGAAWGGGGLAGWQATGLGVLCQVLTTLCEMGHAAYLGFLLSARGLKLDPLTTLSFHSCLACGLLALVGLIFERDEDMPDALSKLNETVGFSWLLVNGANAFLMYFASVVLIYRTDPVTFVIFALGRGLVMDAFSALAFGAPVSIEELMGYIIALFGVQIFNLVRQRPSDFDGLVALLGGFLRSVQSAVFEPEAPSSKALASKKALNNALDDELDREMQLAAMAVGARTPSRRDIAQSSSDRTQFFEIGDVKCDDEDILPPTG